jgi:Rrf2 family nitric oxide-sensitive transcriptional repressor
MRLTAYTDYTLRVLMYLSLRYPDGGVATIDEMAGAYAISRNHLTKIVNELAQRGVIETVRGRAGGARLARDPRDISIGDVVRMAEKDFALVECHEAERPSSCVILPACNLKRGLRRALEAFMQELDRLTLADAVTTTSVAAPLLGMEMPRRAAIRIEPDRGATPRAGRAAGIAKGGARRRR